MKVPAQYRLSKEDFKGAPSWIDRVIYSFNKLLDGVVAILSGQVTFQDNIRSRIVSLTFTTDANYSTGTWTDLNVAVDFKESPIGVLPFRVVEKAAVYTPTKSALGVDWTYANGSVTIGYISGLADSKEYTVTLVIV